MLKYTLKQFVILREAVASGFTRQGMVKTFNERCTSQKCKMIKSEEYWIYAYKDLILYSEILLEEMMVVTVYKVLNSDMKKLQSISHRLCSFKS